MELATQDSACADGFGLTAAVELVLTTPAHEGPVYIAGEHALYVTVERGLQRIDLATRRSADLACSVVRPNGMFLDHEGRLVICEQGDIERPARISRLDLQTGDLTTIVEDLCGLPLNSPNDVVVGPDGVIWFTDPCYGHLQGFRPRPQLGDFVHRFDPATGRHDIVADGFDKPNGIALSPDGKVLYVTDSGANHEPGSFDPARPHHIEAFDVIGFRLGNRRLLAVTHPGFPDGLKVDAPGRIYASAATGVQVFAANGERLGEIAVPGAVNFTFGGPKANVLYITTDDAVWAAVLAAPRQAPIPSHRSPTEVYPMTVARTRNALDASAVDAVLTAAETHATQHGYRVFIAVVDSGGHLLGLRRTDGAQVASSQVAIDKARTAAIFLRPSRDIEAQVAAGRLGALALHDAAALTGGIPLVVGDEVVGAIGTSGETPDEDEGVSIAGASIDLLVSPVPALTAEGARLAAEAAGVTADQRHVWPVVAVVDAGGELVYLRRPDRAQVASVGVATDKARTAAIYRRPSKDFEDQAANGRPSALHLAGAVPLQGGIPLVVDGGVVGAIGVSGASSADEDQALALIGADGFAAAVRAGS
jgi:gluconolactonase